MYITKTKGEIKSESLPKLTDKGIVFIERHLYKVYDEKEKMFTYNSNIVTLKRGGI